MHRAGIIALVCLLASGCAPADSGGSPDGGTLDAGDTERGGLVFRFESRPSIPGDTEQGEASARIEKVVLRFEDVRAIGDSAPGTEHTSKDRFELGWEDQGDEGEDEDGGEGGDEDGDGGNEDDVALHFPQAPPGIYAQLLGDIASYEIRGSIRIGDRDRRFRMSESSAAIGIAVDLRQMPLDPGMTRTVVLRLALDRVVWAVDWNLLVAEGNQGSGEIRIDGSSDMIDAVRDALRASLERLDQVD